VVRSTLRSLLAPQRLIPIVLVSVPMVLIQGRYSRDRFAVALAVAMCILFVLVAPVSWRILFPGQVALAQGVVRLFLYGATGTGIVLSLGVAVPRLLGMGRTFLTQPETLLVCLTFYLVGGWGLGRDIGQERVLAREQARAAQLAREVERTHLLAIRSHLDPHFLFNALNAIAEWCREDGRVAEQAVLQLSSMLRCILDGVHSAAWPLSRELELVRDLFAMHLLRDPSLFELSVEVAPGLGEVPVPPMILLPLAENAVKHGPAAGHRGAIALGVRAEGGQLVITLANPGAYRGPREGSAGLPTLARRLHLAYGGQARLSITGSGERTVAELVVPLGGPHPEREAA
jgi:hypothetical protein